MARGWQRQMCVLVSLSAALAAVLALSAPAGARARAVVSHIRSTFPDLDGKGQPVYRARQGDPRRSRIFWVNQMQAGGPLGYGPPMFDPESGETISGQAYIYGAALDTYAVANKALREARIAQLAAGVAIAMLLGLIVAMSGFETEASIQACAI